MSSLKQHMQDCLRVWPDRVPLFRFLLEHGRNYHRGPETFAGKRMAQRQCYANATRLMLRDRSLTYVEGKIAMYGLPIDHAWCVDADGQVIDPTLRPDTADQTYDRIGDYFGVPFRRDYVSLALHVNGVYGLLDFYYARKTLPQLVDLGLEAGQQWLLNAIFARDKSEGVS